VPPSASDFLATFAFVVFALPLPSPDGPEYVSAPIDDFTGPPPVMVAPAASRPDCEPSPLGPEAAGASDVALGAVRAVVAALAASTVGPD